MNDWKACVGKMSDREVARFGLGASPFDDIANQITFLVLPRRHRAVT